MRRGMSSTVVVTVLVALVSLLLLVWGSSSGSPLVGAPQGTWGPPPLSIEPLPTLSDMEAMTTAPDQGELEPSLDLNQYLVDFIQLAVILTVLYGLLHWLRRLVDEDRSPHEHTSRDEEQELMALLEASGDDVRYRALSEGDPRNGVVACWVALEEAVHAFGLEEDRSQTASELTTSVLARWEVDPDAIRTLSAAYREARFSRHPVTGPQRRAAVDALETIHHDLRRKVRAEQAAREQSERARAGQDDQADRPAPDQEQV